MFISALNRVAFLAVLGTSILGAASPAVAGSSAPRGFVAHPSAILCQPGFVYRCNKYGCFCVRP